MQVVPLELEQDPADGHPRGPVVEATFALPHTHLVALGVDPDVGADTGEEAVTLAPQPPLDGFLRDGQLLCRNAAVVVPHAEPVVAPDDRGALGAAARRDVRATLAVFLGVAALRSEPVMGTWGCGELAAGWQEEGEG